MFAYKIYYKLKPLIPRSLQIFIRRIIVKRKLKIYHEVWPIDERAGKPPEGWQGWPEGKKFALVLTHDVETSDGLKKCRKVAELEMELGFRSSFNFVAEDYPVDKDLCDFLKKNGFEIGIHGLNHRGNIFSPPRRFLNEASRINHYLREWGAVGFRSPSMYRDFELLSFLDILYDSSGFDTDPFEPQPEGLCTIFPLLVPRNSAFNQINQTNPINASNSSNSSNRSNLLIRHALSALRAFEIPDRPDAMRLAPFEFLKYQITQIDQIGNFFPHSLRLTPHGNCPSNYFVELPYTLPQDHTLFLILKEKDIKIWKEKLDWIAQKGGLALILTHTDYMSFNGTGSKINYPVDNYIKFLEYVKSTYSGLYWHRLPREIAHFYKNFIFSSNNTYEV